MTPQERQEFESMKREIDLLKKGQNIQIASGLERLFSTTFLNVRDRSDVDTNAVAREITISTTPTDITVLRYPDKWIYVYVDGKLHRLGAWLTEFDN